MKNAIGQSPPKRYFLPADFKVGRWEDLSHYFDLLLERPIQSVEELELWLLDRSELNAALMEDFRWRYIRMSVNSADQVAAESFQDFLNNISPKVQPLSNNLNHKLIQSPFLSALDKEKYFVYLRGIKRQIEIFNEENVVLQNELVLESKRYGNLASQMMVVVEEKEITMQQAAVYQENPSRRLREKAYREVEERRLEDKDALDDLYDELLQKRHQMAVNAGYENFGDYQFALLGRFDYSPEDCYQFHDAVAQEIMPLMDESLKRRKKILGLDALRPWDLLVNVNGKSPASPFKDVEELLDKSIDCLTRLHPFFGECLTTMRKMDRFDLDSRKGKRPGGYNMDLPESGVPFVFMNAANTFKDMRVMMHESGHAVHAFLTKDLFLKEFRRAPSEVAELAAMGMEMLSMDFWDSFYEDPEELRRAKLVQLERCLDLLPWIATVDKFQHWVYLHPHHTREERNKAWLSILDEFTSDEVEVDDLEGYRKKVWHRQLHIFEMPFYYIEYGFAQLGALAIWKNYCENPQKAIEDYINALSLGYTKTVRELYEAAGIKFDFSSEYIRELMTFIKGKVEELSS